jgi:hypothetical protein
VTEFEQGCFGFGVPGGGIGKPGGGIGNGMIGGNGTFPLHGNARLVWCSSRQCIKAVELTRFQEYIYIPDTEFLDTGQFHYKFLLQHPHHMNHNRIRLELGSMNNACTC